MGSTSRCTALCQAVGEDDPEGYLLQGIRKIVGDKVPIVLSMDLHGIPTDRMFQACDAIVAYHTYPHVDFFETGVRAANSVVAYRYGGGQTDHGTGLYSGVGAWTRANYRDG